MRRNLGRVLAVPADSVSPPHRPPNQFDAVCPPVTLLQANPDVGWEPRHEFDPANVASHVWIVQCAEVPCKLGCINTSSASRREKVTSMTLQEQLREQRQALNAAINNHDLETATSYLHADFVAKGTDGHSYDRQAAVRQLEQFLKPSMNFHSQIDVEDVEVSGDSATLRVRRTERGRMYNPGHFWGWIVMGVIFAALAVYTAFLKPPDPSPFQFWGGIVGYAAGSVFFIWHAFRGGLRSMHQTQRAQETWRSVDGRWLLASEEQIS